MQIDQVMSLLLAGVLMPLPAPAQPEVVLRSHTRLIQVEVIVRDKAGKPVRGLKRGDFEVFEDGKRQDVRFFAGGTEKPKNAVELPPGMISNRVSETGARRGVTAILIDSLNTQWRIRPRALDSLRRFLLTMQPDDRIALYTLGGQFSVLHEFTTNASSLIERLNAMGNPRLPSTEDQAGLILLAGAGLLASTTANEEDFRQVQRANATFSALEGVASHLGGAAGWKSLIWISDGFSLTQAGTKLPTRTLTNGSVYTGERRTLETPFQQMVRALSNANVAVYPIDPRGLMGLPEYEDAGQLLGKATRPWQAENSMLQQVAAATGGRAYANQNDIMGALRQVSDGAQAGYTLAYYARNEQFDGRFRTIRVKLSGEGLTASHRKGYYAVDLKAIEHPTPLEQMRAAAAGVLDSSAIGIDAKLEGGQILARIDTAELLQQAQAGFEVRCTVGVFQFDAEGKPLDSLTDKIEFKLDNQKAAVLAENGMSYQRPVKLNANSASVKLVVRSAANGTIGALSLPVR
jgi:VWFA-related protein